MYKAQQTEVNAFYTWLRGEFRPSKQRENLLPVYVACPAERDNLLKEFLSEYRAEHRYHAMRLALTK